MGRSSHRIAGRRIRAGAVSLTLWAAGFGAAITAIYPGAPAIAEDDPYAEQRASMVQTIELYAMLSKGALGRDHLDPRVMAVMGVVPRHAFLREEVLRGRDWLSAQGGRLQSLDDAYQPASGAPARTSSTASISVAV